MKTIVMIIAAALLVACGKAPQSNAPSPTPVTTQPVSPTPDAMARLERIEKAINAIIAPSVTPIPIPEIINPYETEQERAARIARKGFFLTDEKGNAWGKIIRDDGAEVTKGLPVEGTTLNSGDYEPIATREADGWNVRWHIRAASTPVPTGQDPGPGKTAPPMRGEAVNASATPQPTPTVQPK
jgi:hypothetical protein